MLNHEEEALKAVGIAAYDKAMVHAVLALRQSNTEHLIVVAARNYIRHPSAETYARLAELVDG